jgi:hypothetical protein
VNHSNTHLWYHGTVDPDNTPSSDGVARITSTERDRWWTVAEGKGRFTGEFFSRIGGGNRLSTDAPAGGSARPRDGMNMRWDFGAGIQSTSRVALAANSGAWPNIMTLEAISPNSSETNTVTLLSRSTLSLRLRYQAGQSGSAPKNFALLLDPDANALNTNAAILYSGPLPASGVDAVTSTNLTVALSSVAPGKYLLAARITDGSHTRFLYGLSPLVVSEPLRQLEFGMPSVVGDKLLLQIFGNAGQRIVVEQSSSLPVWIPAVTNLLTGNSVTLELPFNPAPGAVLYRARSSE